MLKDLQPIERAEGRHTSLSTSRGENIFSREGCHIAIKVSAVVASPGVFEHMSAQNPVINPHISTTHRAELSGKSRIK